MSDGAGGIIMPISCDTQIDCRQGDITRALFLVSNLLLRVIRVCGVCVFFYFFPFQGINLSLPPPLLPSAENRLVAPGGGGGPASMLPLSGPAQGCRCSWGAGHVNSLYWVQHGGISELRGAAEGWTQQRSLPAVSLIHGLCLHTSHDSLLTHYLPRYIFYPEPSDLPSDSSY